MVELARLAPVAAAAYAARVDGTVRSDADPVDAGLKPLRETEHCALVLTVDLLQERPLDAAVGHVTDQHLPGERAFLQVDRVAR
ncbi:hypothetical protein [Streptomyces sp. bgisy027]|uniref:hypothetical protein n=1 Tax=unclassified Streptomyces TaxID=2593676 RepID=UPI003D70B97B